jgi:hypothetical protein
MFKRGGRDYAAVFWPPDSRRWCPRRQAPEFDLTSDTYLRWARNYGDNGLISDHVYVPYNLEWPNTR